MALTNTEIVNYLRRSQQYASDEAEKIVDAIEEGREIPYDVAQKCANIIYLNYGINNALPGYSDSDLEKLIDYANAYYRLNDIAAVALTPFETTVKLLDDETSGSEVTTAEIVDIVNDVVNKVDFASKLIDDQIAYKNKTYSSIFLNDLLSKYAKKTDLSENDFTNAYKNKVDSNYSWIQNFTHQDLSDYLKKSSLGTANGPVPLNANKLIDLKYIDPSLKQTEYLIDGWDANANSPAIPPASPDNKGGYYIVTTAGNTTIDGYSNWLVNERIISNGQTWFKGPSVATITGIKGNAESQYTSAGNKELNPDDFDDTGFNNKFVSATEKSKVGNLPTDTNQEISEIRSLASPDFIAVSTIAERDNIGVANRDWGMFVRVGGSINLTYELRKGYADQDISNNANWYEIPDAASVQASLDNLTLDDVAQVEAILRRNVDVNLNDLNRVGAITLGESKFKIRKVEGTSFLDLGAITSGGGFSPILRLWPGSGISLSSGFIINEFLNAISLTNPRSNKGVTEKAVADVVNANSGANPAGNAGEVQFNNGSGGLNAVTTGKYHEAEDAWTFGRREGNVGVNSFVSGGDPIFGGNEASATSSASFGRLNKSTKLGAFTTGSSNEANTINSYAGGTLGRTKLNNQFVWASGVFATKGDAQGGMVFAWATTTTGNPLTLTTNGEPVSLEDNGTYCFHAKINARRTDSKTEDAYYEVKGIIKRGTGASNTTIKGLRIETIYEDSVAWGVTAQADTINGGVEFIVTGEDSKTIQWLAEVKITENIG